MAIGAILTGASLAAKLGTGAYQLWQAGQLKQKRPEEIGRAHV